MSHDNDIWQEQHVGKLWRHFLFLTYDYFATIQRPDSGRMVYKTYIFVNGNL